MESAPKNIIYCGVGVLSAAIGLLQVTMANKEILTELLAVNAMCLIAAAIQAKTTDEDLGDQGFCAVLLTACAILGVISSDWSPSGSYVSLSSDSPLEDP